MSKPFHPQFSNKSLGRKPVIRYFLGIRPYILWKINQFLWPENVFTGYGFDNGFKDVVFFEYEVDTLTKVRPTNDEYLIRNYPVSKMLTYIRFS
jgi:hypothetical protein